MAFDKKFINLSMSSRDIFSEREESTFLTTVRSRPIRPNISSMTFTAYRSNEQQRSMKLGEERIIELNASSTEERFVPSSVTYTWRISFGIHCFTDAGILDVPNRFAN